MYSTKIYKSFLDIDQKMYFELYESSNSSVFLHPNFILAAEVAPLLPFKDVFYIVIYEGLVMKAFVPCYFQESADPFGVLQKTTPFQFSDSVSSLFTHIMHCSESTFVMQSYEIALIRLIHDAMKQLAIENNIDYCGILNTSDSDLIQKSNMLGITADYMWEKFYREIGHMSSIEEFIRGASKSGRKLFRKSLRRFNEDTSAVVKIEKSSFSDLKTSVKQCHDTSEKYGTGHYYPISNFKKFIELCGDIVTIISIHVSGEQISSNICFIYKDTLYLWACGMTYEKIDFSPYLITILKAFEYAKKNNLSIIEIGRTNKEMKERLGFMSSPLFSMITKCIGDENGSFRSSE